MSMIAEHTEKITSILNSTDEIKKLNEILKIKTGISDFFKTEEERKSFEKLLKNRNKVNETIRDYGDFQTPCQLTDKICRYISNLGFNPDVIIEPTCGKGNFVVSSLKFFPGVKYFYCIDIQEKYDWLFKKNILLFSLKNKIESEIDFINDDIFYHSFSEKLKSFLEDNTKNLLILGNPPWITNTELSSINSANSPDKGNIKNFKGIDAITGKGNFDIAEYIIIKIIDNFQEKTGKIAILCKNSVIKNIIKFAKSKKYFISNIKELIIDSKNEFDINADSALFLADIGSKRDTDCSVYSFYQSDKTIGKFGWVEENFVSNIELYRKYKNIDGQSPIVWRNGVKHDAIKTMVLRKESNNTLVNGFKQVVDVEGDLIYPFLKGSELKEPIVKSTDNRIIITQKAPNENTRYIAKKNPKLWDYLVSHSDTLDNRKSTIYKNRARFSIFGIGDYSFKPFKIGIPGLYKTIKFSLVLPIENKPVMFDDTCYYISFDNFKTAFFTWIILNFEDVKNFLYSIAFLDSKRPFTKELLMRINLLRLAKEKSFKEVYEFYKDTLQKYFLYELNKDDYEDFLDSFGTGLSNLSLFQG